MKREAPMPEIWRRFAKGLGIVSAAASSFFAWLFYEEFWRYARLFDAEGRYFDAEAMIVHNADSAFYSLPALGLAIVAVVLLALSRKGRR